MSRFAVAAGIAVLFLLGAAGSGAAQIQASEPAVVSQTIDGATITIEYSRPSARGRTLFGDLVAWGQSWTGANWATTLGADRDIRLNGVDIAAGKYSLWWIPREGPWTLMLHPDTALFHFQKPDSTDGRYHVAAMPETGPHVELLTWSFPTVTGDAATLRMQWGTTALPIQIIVQPTKPVTLEQEQRATYIGNYEMTIPEGLGWPTSGTLEVFETDGLLRAKMPFPIHPGDELEVDLIPAGLHRFSPGIYRDGKLFNVEMGVSFEFDVEDRVATAVTLRGVEGSSFGEGRRIGG